MKAEIISIGTEVLLGSVVNTNAAYLSGKLGQIGIEPTYQTTVGDDQKHLASIIKEAFSRSDIVITTGGLGPTHDDITVEIVSKTLGKNLIFDRIIAKRIKNHFKHQKISMPKVNLRQAYIPEGATVLKNEVGTAPGLIIETKNKVLICLPGVPKEMIPMVEREVLPYLKRRYAQTHTIRSTLIKIVGMSESTIYEQLTPLLKANPKARVGIYPRIGQVDIKITRVTKIPLAKRAIDSLEKKITQRLGDYIFGKNEETLETVAGGLLIATKETVSIAESCSGGLIADRITNVPGSSKYFKLSVVAYSNETKASILRIPSETIKKRGAVSKEVALGMARSIRLLGRTDIGIGVTGIAGPSGATKTKPVGLVYIAMVAKNHRQWKAFRFIGDRESIKFSTSQAALDMIRKYLLKKRRVARSR